MFEKKINFILYRCYYFLYLYIMVCGIFYMIVLGFFKCVCLKMKKKNFNNMYINCLLYVNVV